MADQRHATRSLRGSALVQLVVARLREFYRQPEAVFWVYCFPLLMVVALGIAFRNRPVENITVDIVRSPQSQRLADGLAADNRIKVQVLSRDECRQRLRTGKSDLFLAVGEQPQADSTAGFSNPESPGAIVPGASVEFFFDPTRPGSIVARDRVDQLVQEKAGRRDMVMAVDHEVNEPGSRYIDFLVPGLIGMGLMGGGLWGVGFAIVDMRIRKLLKRFLATPMRRTEFLLGVMISRMVFMIPEMVLLLLFSWLVFGVVIYGNAFALVLLVFLGAIQFSGIGLLIAARAKTLESISGLMNLAMLPMWLLCGVFFPAEYFPEAVQPFIHALPLTPLINALRSVMLEGTPLVALWKEVVLMAVWGGVTFFVALKIFRWHD